jgi:hypothetical protein
MLLATGICLGPYEFIAAIGILGLGWVRASRISEK